MFSFLSGAITKNKGVKSSSHNYRFLSLSLVRSLSLSLSLSLCLCLSVNYILSCCFLRKWPLRTISELARKLEATTTRQREILCYRRVHNIIPIKEQFTHPSLSSPISIFSFVRYNERETIFLFAVNRLLASSNAYRSF